MIYELSIAHGCPILCRCCPQEKIQAAYTGPRLMSMDTFRECLSKAPAGAFISFAGFAEPYLNPKCTEMILAARLADYEVMLYTTCVGMTLEDVRRLQGVHFKPLCIHLPDADGNAKINVTPEYLEVVKALCEAFPDAELMTMGRLHPSVDYLRPKLRNAYLHTRAGNVSGMPVLMRKGGRLKCRVSPDLTDNVILPDGTMVLCCSDWSMNHVIGNILEQTFEEIHAGEAIAKVRESMRDGECLCRRCEFSEAV